MGSTSEEVEMEPTATEDCPPRNAITTTGARSKVMSGAKKLNKADILERARIRREQLAKELARTKVELWETMIEQGVLTNISKDGALSHLTH